MAIREGNAPLNVITLTAAGTVIGDATQIPVNASPALILATGDNAVGIKLPKAVAGKMFIVKNTGAGGLKVWPYDSGDQINAITAGSAITMATVTSATFVSSDNTHWYTVPLLPS